MTDPSIVEEIAKYDFVQYVVPDFNGIPRGKVFCGKAKDRVARHGTEIGNAICLFGPNSETPFSAIEFVGPNFPNEDLRPCLETLTPWPWISRPGRRIGNVLCDLYSYDGEPSFTSPRQLMKSQLDALYLKHGLVFRSGIEFEFIVFKEGTLQALGGDVAHCLDVSHWENDHDLLADLVDLLGVMGVEVSGFHPEFTAGQWEVNTDIQEGVKGGDAAYYLRRGVKGFFQTRGYTATFMTKPRAGKETCNGQHLNHSLWAGTGEEKRNAMLDPTSPDKLSKTARYWIAGILHHAPALTALCCPTYNCYRRLHNFGAPFQCNWGPEDRNALLRVRNAHDNVFVENRLPSGSSTPYLVIAATVAAGLDGLDRQLECPQAAVPELCGAGKPSAQLLPKSLAEALEALEKDEHLTRSLGETFVKCYVATRRDIDLKLREKAELDTEEKEFEYERKMYMMHL